MPRGLAIEEDVRSDILVNTDVIASLGGQKVTSALLGGVR